MSSSGVTRTAGVSTLEGEQGDVQLVDGATADGKPVKWNNTTKRFEDATADLSGTYLAFTQEAVNVKNPAFGAVGDGAADDTAAITAAIAAVPATGGAVIFPPGVYKVTGTITVNKAYCTLIGHGATIKPSAAVGRATKVLSLTATEASLHGLRVDGSDGGGTLVYCSSSRHRVIDCTLVEAGEHGVFLDFTSGVCWVRGNRIQAFSVGPSGHGMLVTGADHHIVDNDIGGFGLGSGIVCSGASAVSIIGNQVYSNLTGITLYLPYRMRVIGNQVEQNSQHGIVLNADGGTVGQVVIAGNNCWENGMALAGCAGIAAFGSVNMPALAITGNTCTDDRGGAATQEYGVLVNNAALTRCIVTGNALQPVKTTALQVTAGAVTAANNITA